MITCVDVAGATFQDVQHLSGLNELVFIYGANGTGKTTISRLLRTPHERKGHLNWRNGRALETLVYNRDFVEENFGESDELEGVFTLGKENVELRNKIREKQEERAGMLRKLDGLTQNLEGEEGDEAKKGVIQQIDDLDEDYNDRFWEDVPAAGDSLREAFTGFLNSKRKFRERLVQESQSNNAQLHSIEHLRQKAATLYEEDASKKPLVAKIDTKLLPTADSESVLSTPVTGKEDVAVAELIKKLKSGDWVQKGMEYFEECQPTCPFCQEQVEDDLASKLEEYFDASYKTALSNIQNVTQEYNRS